MIQSSNDKAAAVAAWITPGADGSPDKMEPKW